MSQRYTVLSLFSGALGLDLGLAQAGRPEADGPCPFRADGADGRFDLLGCVELLPATCGTIAMNRDAGRIALGMVFDGDISRMDPRAVMRQLGLRRGEIDLVVGGPPCPSFSTAGRRRSVQDPRGTLLWQFRRFVNALQPRMFVMENVRGLMSARLSPADEPGSVVRRLVRGLRGYRVDCFEANAVNYGAPQLRERAIFVGNRLGLAVDIPAPTHGPGLLPWRTLGEAISGLEDASPEVLDFSPRKKRYLAMVPPGGNWRSLPEDVAREAMGRAFLAKGGRSGWWRRLSMDLPCPTLVTMPNHASTALCHPTETRALSLREYARIQEFPDGWRFCGSTAEKYAQVGNAVPVRLGKVVGEAVIAALEGGRRAAASDPRLRVVHVRSHVRTRQWFRNGRAFIHDAADPSHAAYSPGGA